MQGRCSRLCNCHELSHINNKNHSKSFWATVATVLPNYKEQEKWLKANRKIMEIL